MNRANSSDEAAIRSPIPSFLSRCRRSAAAVHDRCGALASVPVISTLHFQDAARYITDTDQSYVVTVVLLSKKWFDVVPGDLQAITRAAATQVNNEVRPWALDFLLEQRKAWMEKGGDLIALSPAEKTELMARYRTIGDDIVKSKPQLKPIWDLLVATALRSL